MDSGSLVIYILITIMYYIIISLPIPDIFKTVTKYIYFLLIIATQIMAAYTVSKTTCGTAQISEVFIWGFIPWVVVFLGLNLILSMFPGWKAPFSNTFGYLVVKLAGVGDVFNNMLKPSIQSGDTGLNKIIEKVYEDNSILINEMTPSNFDNVISKLSKVMNTSSATFSQNREKLRYLVEIKDNVSSFIWSVLIGTITASMASMGLMSSECVKSTEQIHKEAAAYKAQIKQQDENKKQPRTYTVRD